MSDEGKKKKGRDFCLFGSRRRRRKGSGGFFSRAFFSSSPKKNPHSYAFFSLLLPWFSFEQRISLASQTHREEKKGPYARANKRERGRIEISRRRRRATTAAAAAAPSIAAQIKIFFLLVRTSTSSYDHLPNSLTSGRAAMLKELCLDV